MSIIDEFDYPWADPIAQELYVTLTQLNPASSAALLIAQQARLDATMINSEQAPYLVWVEILDQAALNGLTRAIVTVVRGRLNASSPRRPFLDALLADQRPPTEGEPPAPMAPRCF